MSAVPALQTVPAGVRTAADYAPLAQAVLDPAAHAYFEASSGTGITRRANRDAWDALALWPRVLRPHGHPDTRVDLLGRRWPTPLLVAPMALQRLAHPDGELAMAVAASAQGAGFVLSAQTSLPMQAIAQAIRSDAGRGPLWFQLYLQPDRGATLDLVAQAEAAGFEALVLTVDAAVRAPHAGSPLPSNVSAVHMPASAVQDPFAASPGWIDVEWLLGRTKLPVLLKGLLHPEDAREAQRCGSHGIVVSNHGGRTLDSAAPTAAALPRIADAVGSALPVLVDGGIQSGNDILKALALGARAVLIGRPMLHGLAVAGAAGAAHVLRLLKDELAIAMAQCGVAEASAAPRQLVAPFNP